MASVHVWILACGHGIAGSIRASHVIAAAESCTEDDGIIPASSPARPNEQRQNAVRILFIILAHFQQNRHAPPVLRFARNDSRTTRHGFGDRRLHCGRRRIHGAAPRHGRYATPSSVMRSHAAMRRVRLRIDRRQARQDAALSA